MELGYLLFPLSRHQEVGHDLHAKVGKPCLVDRKYCYIEHDNALLKRLALLKDPFTYNAVLPRYVHNLRWLFGVHLLAQNQPECLQLTSP